jgi:hypothetical protein
MRKFLTKAAAVIAAPLALVAAPASAENLDLTEVAAALALPIITEAPEAEEEDPMCPEGEECEASLGGDWTSIIITNTGSKGVRLGFQVLSGDLEDSWTANSFDCPLSGNETTHFLIAPNEHGDNSSTIYFECSIPGATGDDPDSLNVERVEVVNAAKGILFAYVKDAFGDVVSNDVLIGTATVIDFDDDTAWSVDAVPFQGGDVLAQDGNREFRFDGLEFLQFPSMVLTQFHAPSYDVEAELILFTLDGTTGAAPDVELKVDFWNDDELKRDADYAFDCFDIVKLEDIDPRFKRESLGSSVGHLKLTPKVASQEDEARVHDILFGDGNGVRRVPVHGWIVQEIEDGGSIRTSPDDYHGKVKTPELEGEAAYARNLYQNKFSLVPFGKDVVVFNAGP